MATCLGRHLVPDLTTWSRRRWSYAQRVREVVVAVFSIPKASLAMAHQANQNTNDIRHAALAYIKVRNVFVRSLAVANSPSETRNSRDVSRCLTRFQFPMGSQSFVFVFCPRMHRERSAIRLQLV